MEDNTPMTLQCPNCLAIVELKQKKTGKPFSKVAECSSCKLKWYWEIGDVIEKADDD